MQHCERDGEEDEFEGHFPFFSFFLFFFEKTTVAVDAGLRELAVVGEEEEDVGLRWIGAGSGKGGENGELGWSGGDGLGIVVGGRQRDDGVRR